MTGTLNEQVRAFWERGPVGTEPRITGDLAPLSREWFERVEGHRYALEPFIHAVAQFARHGGKRILEVGVGAGTDHLQWARAGCDCHGVDLTEAAIETTRRRLALYGLCSELRRADAEALPYPEGHFDLVWSWGVIHHSERPERIVAEIHRVLRPGGLFLGMMYKRRSLAVLALWAKHAAFKGRPWRSFADVLWHHMESAGTKGYTADELRRLFGAFGELSLEPILTPYDTQHVPRRLAPWFPAALGAYFAIRAEKGAG